MIHSGSRQGSNRGRWGLAYLAGIPFRGRLSREGMEGMRDRRLAWLVWHAAATMPFYRFLLERRGVDPESIRGMADIERLPTIGRLDLRKAGESAWADDLAPERRVLASTSGSSDAPLALAYRFSDRLRKHAIGLHCMSMYGWRPWHRGMALGSQALPSGHRLERLGISRWEWVDPTRPVDEWLAEYDRIRPHALHSYPSALREFCFAARKRGPLDWLPRVLSVGGELCPEDLPALTTEVFGCRPLTMYGAVEGGRLAFECRAHCGLHVRPDAVHIELLHNGRPVGPGETGAVHITSLINTVMPIIRYELGDLATWESGDCPCGLWWPRLTLSQGRMGDVIPLPGGRRVPVTNLAAIVGKSDAVRQFQFVRRSETRLVLRYEPEDGAGESLEPIRQALALALPGIELELEKTGQLPRTHSGKVRRYADEVANQSPAGEEKGNGE
jgi:phenylacetate-CoA ligase